VLESANLMHQHNSDTLIQEEEQKLNMSKREEIVLRYRSASPIYYRDGQENKEFEQFFLKFEPLIHYVIEKKPTI